MRLLLFISLLIFVQFELDAQINPPDFLCVSGDSLYWELPQNNCGPFNAYVVYASQDINGPYSILSTITDPAQTSFLHQDPGVSTWYYYLESDYNCPGEIVLQSDTLDNEMPESPIFQTASVNGNTVVLTWAPSPSPEVIGYIISRNIPGQGTISIDTVFSGNTYIDTTANPEIGSETYFLEAIDACGNRSLISNPHSTIWLQAAPPDGCQRDIELSWTPYNGWSGGIDRQEIWVAKDGDPAILAATVDGSATAYAVDEVDDQANYCVTIVAIANETDDWEVASNEVCVFAEVTQRQSYLIASNATVDATGNVSLSWLWDAEAELDEVAIQRSDDGLNFSDIERTAPPNPLNPTNSYNDNNAQPELGPMYYEISTRDACGEIVTSNTVATIHLQATTASTGNNELNWTPFINDLATINSYQLYRVTQSSTTLIGTFDKNTFTEVDQIDLGDAEQLQACYFVEAEATLLDADSSIVNITSRSNLACAVQDAEIYIPNAFSPNGDGRNDEFFPYLQYGTPADYRLVIYDRWGGQRFISTDISQGWDGTSIGRIAPIGMYIYHLYVLQSSGTEVERTGEIYLLR